MGRPSVNRRIPIHRKIAKSIAKTETGYLDCVAKNSGAAYNAEATGDYFQEHREGLGLEGYSLHGLRKAASRRMAEVGLSNQLIKLITGHSTDS